MPKQNFNRVNSDLYSYVYEQYYFKDTKIKKIRPIQKSKKTKKQVTLNKLFAYICVILLLFYILPFSFKTFIADIFPVRNSNPIEIDYKKILYLLR